MSKGRRQFTRLRHGLVRHVGLAMVTASTVSTTALLFNMSLSDLPLGSWASLVPVVAVGTAGLCALPVGILQAAVVQALRVYLRRAGLDAWFRLVNHRTTHWSRAPVIGAHVVATQITMALVTLLVCAAVASPLLDRIQSDDFRRLMLLLTVSFAGCLALITALLMAPWFVRAWTWVDGRSRLPLPTSASWRFFIVALLPLVALLALLWSHSRELGIALYFVAAVVFLLAEGLVFFALRWLGRRAGSRRVLLVGWAVLLACCIATPAMLDASEQLTRATMASNVTKLPLSLLRAATDFDGDDAAGTYGGGDCAAFDPDISPGAVDVPGNELDEDCDGEDASPSSPVKLSQFSGTLPAEQIKPYNVLWIVGDALAVDHLSVYGAKRRTTPYLERFASEAVIFERAFVQGVTTHVSLPSMFVGKDARNMQWRYGSDPTRVQLGPNELTLAERLREKGYRTGAVAVDYVQQLPDVLRGFDERFEYTEREGAPRTTQLALRFLAPHLSGPAPANPFFLLAYYVDAHQPYIHRGLGEPSFGKWKKDRYDSQIALVDRYAGMLIDQLRGDERLWSETIVIFTSDHGEEFRERGNTGHGWHCHEEVMHVPLLAHIPNVEAQRSSALVALTDVVPTILELTGHDEATADGDGQSLLAPLSNPDHQRSDRAVTCVALKQGGITAPGYFIEALRTHDQLLVNHRMGQRVELFNTRSDPEELRNLALDTPHQAAAQSLKQRLSDGESGNLWQLRLP